MGSVDAPDAAPDRPAEDEDDDDLSSFQVVTPGDGRVEVHGEVDAATAPSLDAAIKRAATEVGADDEVVVDFAGLSFIDSSGLSVLVANHQRLSSQSRTLVIAEPPVAARRLFEIAGLDLVLTIR